MDDYFAGYYSALENQPFNENQSDDWKAGWKDGHSAYVGNVLVNDNDNTRRP